jgi:hypothetical protein
MLSTRKFWNGRLTDQEQADINSEWRLHSSDEVFYLNLIGRYGARLIVRAQAAKLQGKLAGKLGPKKEDLRGIINPE